MKQNPENKNNNNEIDDNIDEVLGILDEYKKTEPKDTDTEDIKEEDFIDSGATRISDAVTAHFTEVIDIEEVRKGVGDMTIHLTSVDDETTVKSTAKSIDESEQDGSDDLSSTEIQRMPKRRKKSRATGVFGFFSGIFKTLMYIIFVLGVSAYVSYNVIMIANDVFAFVKPENEKIVVLEPEMNNNMVAKLLKENGIINYERIFEMYAKNKFSEEKFLSGEFTLKPSMNYDEILSTLKFIKVERDIVKLTIPEGFTTDQIIELFVSNGIGTKEGFVDVINNYAFKHEFIKKLNAIQKSPDRRYRLEGYMFPDTYLFYRDDSEIAVINKLLNNFESKFDESFYDRCDEIGMNFDDVIILASMVEAEARYPIDLEWVSSVFHNRLKSTKADYKKMQCDATIQYFLPERKPILPTADTLIDHPYNTYVYEGLPPGAIGNPGIDAITAALWPDDPITDSGRSFKAYYFVSNLYGNIYYAGDSLAAHNQNIAQAKKDNEEYNKLYNNEGA